MKIASEQEMFDFAESFAKSIASPIVIELIGDVGAGKTTFVRGFAKGLGVKRPVTSPSFTISKSYALKSGGQMIHYDFYRLTDPGIMLEDLQENLKNPQNVILIEWSNSVENMLPENRYKILIKKLDDDTREVEVNTQDNHLTPFSTRFVAPVVTGLLANSLPVGREMSRKALNRLSLYLDTSTPTTILRLNNKEYSYEFKNDLAEKLLEFIHDKLKENNKDWNDISEITFMSGPGSFTGLRIGATIVNTLASELNIPLFDHHGKKHQIIIPDYGREANITPPRK